MKSETRKRKITPSQSSQSEPAQRSEVFWRQRRFIGLQCVVLFFSLNFVLADYSCQLDLSKNQVNSLSKSSQKVFRGLEEPILIEAFVSTNVPGELHRGFRPILANLQAIRREDFPNLVLRIVDPQDEETQAEAQARGLQGIPIEEQKELSASVRLGYYGVYLQQGEGKKVINLIANNWFIDDFEYRLLREIKQLKSRENASGIAIATGEGFFGVKNWSSRDDQNKENLHGFKVSMEEDLGKVEEIPLDEPVPTDIRFLFLIGGPELQPKQRYHVDQFLVRGGNVIAMLKGFDFDIMFHNPQFAQYGLATENLIGASKVDGAALGTINAWLGAYGVTLRGEVLLEPSLAMPVIDIFNNFPRQINYPAWAIYGVNSGNIQNSDLAQQLVFPWFSGLQVQKDKQSGVQYQTLVKSSPSVISRAEQSLAYKDVFDIGGKIGADPLGRTLPVAVWGKGSFTSAFSKADLPTGAQAQLFRQTSAGENEAGNLIVIGTPYFVSDILLRNQSGAQAFQINRAFMLNLLETLVGDTDLLEARNKRAVISSIPTFAPWIESLITWLFVLFFPVSLSIFGTMRLIRRSRFSVKR